MITSLSGGLTRILAILTVLTIVACGMLAPSGDSNVPVNLHLAGPLQSSPQAGLGAVPGLPDSDEISAHRKISASELSVLGDAPVGQGGTGNYSPGAGALIIQPGGEDDLAWAMYSLQDLVSDRPVQIGLEVDAAPIQPGGEEDLPLSFYLGLSDYTRNTWEWRGPFDAAQQLQMNSDALRERYSSAAGQFSFVVATVKDPGFVAPNNPQGLSGVTVNATVITTEPADSPLYFATKPHFPAFTEAKAGSAAKQAAALDPAVHYVNLAWLHVADPGLTGAEATEYSIYRKGPEDADRVLIGTVEAPGNTFVDPTDNLDGIPEPIPGATYEYSVRGSNDAGSTPLDRRSVTVPLLAPANFYAFEGLHKDKIVLSWEKSEGATGYRIYRDSDPTPLVELGDVDTYEDLAVQDFTDYSYHVRAFNAYGESIDTPIVIGYCGWGAGQWNQFGGNDHSNRCTSVIGPQTNNLKWSIDLFPSASGAPDRVAIPSANGNVYVTIGRWLLAVSRTGRVQWQIVPSAIDASLSHVVLADDGTVIVGDQVTNDTYFYAYYPDGTPRWTLGPLNAPNGKGVQVGDSPVISPDGSIYVGASSGLNTDPDQVLAINPNGTLKWMVASGGEGPSYNMAIGNDGHVYHCTQSKLKGRDPLTGAQVFTADFGGENLAIAVTGEIYQCENSNSTDLRRFTSLGLLDWDNPLLIGNNKGLAVAPDGTVYGSKTASVLRAVNSVGTIKWTSGADTTGFGFVAAIGGDGTIYWAPNNEQLLALNPDGTEKWSYANPFGADFKSPTIGDDGTLYVIDGSYRLFAFGP